MKQMLLVASGGALGSLARYGVYLLAARGWGPVMPWGTLCVNVLGSLVIGLIAGAADYRLTLHDEARLFLLTGVLGGFTTFSAFALDFARLLQVGDIVKAFGYVIASVGLSLGAALLGLILPRALS